MPRPRGNARKRKARLTDQTFTAVVAGERPEASAPDGVDGVSYYVEETSGIEDLLELLRMVPDAPTVPASYNDPTQTLRDIAGFPASLYVIGLLQCTECHNEIIYYQKREVLDAGYRFRCRFCQHELIATLP